MKSIQPQLSQADCIVIGAGIFGLYAAKHLTSKGLSVIVIEQGSRSFSRASAINQARIHNGYHYPRSADTVREVRGHYLRFIKDFEFAISHKLQQIYAIASEDSKTSVKQFVDFCNASGLPLEPISGQTYFKDGSVGATFITDEYSFDFNKIKKQLLDKIGNKGQFVYDYQIQTVSKNDSDYIVEDNSGRKYSAPLVVNATYFGLNGIIGKFGADKFDVKYELCEVVFCRTSKSLKNIGLTVMDGDYFSLMPFGSTDLHTLTSVQHTPLKEFSDISEINSVLPGGGDPCEMHSLKGCVICADMPDSSWDKMHDLYKSYMRVGYDLEYDHSRFEFKTILKESEFDDSRPTLIKKHTENPTFISVLSGKISTIYDIEKYI